MCFLEPHLISTTFDTTSGAESRKVVEIGNQKQWYFTKTIRLPEVDHAVRLVISPVGSTNKS